MATLGTTNQRQCVWLVRYGLTEHPLVEDLGPYDSDIDSEIGVEHANCIAKRIARGHIDDGCGGTNTNVDDTIPSVLYTSPFLRTAHTGHIIAKELGDNIKGNGAKNVKVRVEDGLWEWLIPSLLVTKSTGIKTEPRSVQELKDLLDSESDNNKTDIIDLDYVSCNPYDKSGDDGTPRSDDQNEDYYGRPRWTESEEELLLRCKFTLSGILEALEHNESICIVSHAPCDQAMAYYFEGATTPKESCLNPWPLGGITMFSRPLFYETESNGTVKHVGSGQWSMELYGNTEHMPGEYKNGLKEWSLPCFTKTS